MLVGTHVTSTMQKGILVANVFQGKDSLLFAGLISSLATTGTWLQVRSLDPLLFSSSFIHYFVIPELPIANSIAILVMHIPSPLVTIFIYHLLSTLKCLTRNLERLNIMKESNPLKLG
ncbi:hypothetical protein NE237_021463 [Protea cynaroides]|uniref:Uncharacterized protein n=1 Tax=Protea cynaroides TaxID=273540 RepID=A0A9Q0HB63_9MAGN|nr:hypothetical protein NE237_021463 [Protea cynaroides]